MAKKKGSWIVIIESTVTEEIICDDCTQEEAENDPFAYAIEENIQEHLDWEVKSVTENR
jgi:hypothetical protein